MPIQEPKPYTKKLVDNDEPMESLAQGETMSVVPLRTLDLEKWDMILRFGLNRAPGFEQTEDPFISCFGAVKPDGHKNSRFFSKLRIVVRFFSASIVEALSFFGER